MFNMVDSKGNTIDPDSWSHTYSWNEDGTLNYEETTNDTGRWRKTYTYNNGQLINESAWVNQ